jgi:sugar O-acyltransferase (sialic acid O-acetyltransferase NeuD family)
VNDGIKVVLLGAGGHARGLIDCIQQQGRVEITGILDPNSSKWGTACLGVPITGGDDKLPDFVVAGSTHFVVGVLGVGPNPVRRALFEKAVAAGLRPMTVIHPKAIVSPSASLGEGVQIMPGAIVNAGVQVGTGAVVNSGAIIEHDCKLGGFVHIAPGCCLCGGVDVGADAFVGAGSTVIQNVRVGSKALVAAGAVVIRDVVPGGVVGGVPAGSLEGSGS